MQGTEESLKNRYRSAAEALQKDRKIKPTQKLHKSAANQSPITCDGEHVLLEVPLVVRPDGVRHAGLRAAAAAMVVDEATIAIGW
jgi:hypothetical protein